MSTKEEMINNPELHMPKIKFIGISGKTRSGKDTLGEFIALNLENAGHDVYVTHFADALKEEVIKLLKPSYTKLFIAQNPFPGDSAERSLRKMLYTPSDPEDRTNKEVLRPILQGWGQYRRTFFANNYWIERLILDPVLQQRYKEAKEGTGLFVIVPDVRYLNEATYLKEANALLYRIDRYIGIGVNQHNSETELDNYEYFDWKISNNSSLANLQEWVKRTLVPTIIQAWK